jgi:hypothetical protein
MNERDTLSPDVARADLLRFLAETDADVVCLQEWSRSRDQILNNLPAPWAWTRPKTGGGPILYRTDRRTLRSTSAVRLSRGEFVGHLPGRRSRLGPSIATEAVFGNLRTGRDDAYLSYHLTAEVQKGKRYRRDPGHLLRVLRHRREKFRLGRRGRFHVKKGRRTRLCGDGNFDGMEIPGFVSCWAGHAGGTLGGRAVDDVFDTQRAGKPRTFKTRSDHDAVCVESEE